jgi:Sulfotransferase domain
VPKISSNAESRRTRGIPKLVLCAGLKSSGSTWLYNVVSHILRAGSSASRGNRRTSSPRAASVLQFYADTLETFPQKAECASYLVVKTHVPSASLQFLASFSRACVFLTVREPRDSVASVVQRFGHSFDNALDEIAQGSTRMVEFADIYRPKVFRYEDRFYEDPETVSRIAEILKVRVPKILLKNIFDLHTSEAVEHRVKVLQRRGVFGQVPHPDQFDPKTHWHPGHVGDREIGKYPKVLSSKQQRTVLTSMREFCRAFGYPVGPVREPTRPQKPPNRSLRKTGPVRRSKKRRPFDGPLPSPAIDRV